MSNADRIRAMDDKELAEWICGIMTWDNCNSTCPARDICDYDDNGLVKWMKQPAKEG